MLRAGETLAYLQKKQAALTVDYVTVAVVDAPGGEALTEDGLQVVESLLQKIAPARSGVGSYFYAVRADSISARKPVPLQILHTQNGHAQNHQHDTGGTVQGLWGGLVGKHSCNARPQQGEL